MDRKIAAFTTTIPVEVILAAGYKPLDLNNIFISSGNALDLVENAELSGFAGSSCSWIKGLYSVLKNPELNKDIDLFIAVTEGDCSNARVLEEIISQETDIRTHIFNFPYSRKIERMEREIALFADFLGTTVEKSEKIRERLLPVRRKLKMLDELSYTYPGAVTGEENHLFLVSSSDFCGDCEKFEYDLDTFLKEVGYRKNYIEPGRRKIGFLGVPPIVPIHAFVEKHNATIVYNEIQREFAMLDEYETLAEQYVNYTYPYSAEFRFNKALGEIKRRRLDGLIHYVQSFCHRQLEDIILRNLMRKNDIQIPLITMEFDKPVNKIDSRVATRIEAFLETI